MTDPTEGTLEDAARWLAELAAAPAGEKRAFGDFLTSLGGAVRDNPAISHALVGGGIGAVAGGLNTAYGNSGRDPSRKRSLLGGALTGGLAGAGVGAGVGLARQGMEGLSGGGSGGPGNAGGGHGQYVDPTTGKTMAIDPNALKNDPELAAKVKSLTTPTLQSKLVGGLGAGIGAAYDAAPITTSAALPLGAADLALHGPGFGRARATPETAGGYYGRRWFSDGAAGHKLLPDSIKETLFGNKAPGLHDGVTSELPGHAAPPAAGTRLGRLWQAAKSRVRGDHDMGDGVADVLGGTPGPGKGDGVAFRASTPVMQDVEHSTPGTDTQAASKWTTREPAFDANKKPKVNVEELNHGQIGDLKRLGVGKDEAFKDRTMFRVPGTNRHYAGAKSMRGALAGRAGGLGVAGLGEYLIRGLGEEADNKQAIRDLVARHAKPVEGGK